LVAHVCARVWCRWVARGWNVNELNTGKRVFEGDRVVVFGGSGVGMVCVVWRVWFSTQCRPFGVGGVGRAHGSCDANEYVWCTVGF